MRIKTFLYAVLLTLTATAAFAGTPYKIGVIASYYADKFHGRTTANGEVFNMYGYTAAHKTLPFNTIVKVTNLENGKSISVRINDRGPFIPGREIDLSKAAAIKLDMMKRGTAKVSLEIIQSTDLKAMEAEQVSTTLVPGSRWDIQLGAFSDFANAETLAQRLLASGFKNVVYQKTKTVTRVALRNIAAEDVEELIDQLERKGFTTHFVHRRTAKN